MLIVHFYPCFIYLFIFTKIYKDIYFIRVYLILLIIRNEKKIDREIGSIDSM